MAGLERIGVSAVVENIGKYVSDMGTLNKATAGAADATEKAAKSSNGLSTALASVGKVVAGLGLAGLFGAMVKSASDSQTVVAQLDNVLKSTSGTIKEATTTAGHWATVTTKSGENVAAWEKALKAASGTISRLQAKQAAGIPLTAGEAAALDKARGAAAQYQAALAGATTSKKVWVDASMQAAQGAGFERQAILDLASSLQKVTRFSDESILSVEIMLMRFKGMSQDVLPKATKAVLDIATAMGIDTGSAAKLLGKLMQDPIGSMQGLTRAGIKFTAEQEKTVKALVKSGKLLEAQKYLLDQVAIATGGAAEAAGNTFAGKLDILKNAIDDVLEAAGNQFLPILTDLVTRITQFIADLGPAAPVLLTIAAAIGAIGVVAGPVGIALGLILGPIGAIAVAAGLLAAAISTNFGGIRDTIQGILNQIKKPLEDIRNALKHVFDDLFGKEGATEVVDANGIVTAVQNKGGTIGERISKAFSDIIKDLHLDPASLQAFADNILNSIRDWITTGGPGRILEGLVNAINGVALIVGEKVSGIAQGLMDGIKNWIAESGPQKLIDGLASLFGGIALVIGEKVSGVAQGIMDGIKDWIANNGPQKLLDGLGALLSNIATKAGDLVSGLAQGLVDAIRQWFADKGPEKLYQGVLSAVKGVVSRAAEIVTELAAALVKGIADFIGGKGDLSDGIHKALNSVGEWLSGGGASTLLELGVKLVAGILAGIAGLVAGIAQAIVDGVTKGINDVTGGKGAKPTGTTVGGGAPGIGTPLNLPGRTADVGGGLPGGGGKTGSQSGDFTGRQAEALNNAQAGQETGGQTLGMLIGQQIATDIQTGFTTGMQTVQTVINTLLSTAFGDALMVTQEIVLNALTILIGAAQAVLDLGFQTAVATIFTNMNAAIQTVHMASLQAAFTAAFTNGPIAYLLGDGMGQFLSAMTAIVDAIVQWVQAAAPTLTGIGKAIATFISQPFGAITTAIKAAVGKGLRAILAAVKGSGLLLFIPQLSNLIGSFEAALASLGAAKGGLFSGGLLRVGEHGEEMIAPASKIAVFPNNVTRMLDQLSTIMASPMPLPAMAGGVVYNQQQSRSMGDVNMYGVTGANDAMRRYALMRALGRV